MVNVMALSYGNVCDSKGRLDILCTKCLDLNVIFSMSLSCLVLFFRNRPPGSSFVRRVDFPMLLVFVSPRQPCWCCYQPGSVSNTLVYQVSTDFSGAIQPNKIRLSYYTDKITKSIAETPIVCLSNL